MECSGYLILVISAFAANAGQVSRLSGFHCYAREKEVLVVRVYAFSCIPCVS